MSFCFLFQASIVDVPDPSLFWLAGREKKDFSTFTKERQWRLNLPPEWVAGNRKMHLFGKGNLFVAPFIEQDPLFQNCCLLAAVAIGIAHRREMQEVLRLGGERRSSCTSLWKALKSINSFGSKNVYERRFLALERLRSFMERLVEEFNLDVEVFRNCDLQKGDGDALRRELDKMGVSLQVLRESAGYQEIFMHPRREAWKRMRLCVVSLSFLQGEISHTGYIADPDADQLQRKGLKTACLFCQEKYSRNWLPVHKCRSSLPKCRLCRRKFRPPNAYIDFLTQRLYCLPSADGYSKNCEDCRKDFPTRACYRAHRKFCCKSKKICEDCGVLYSKENYHSCGRVFCRSCRSYKDAELSDEGVGSHQCRMLRPNEQEEVDRLGFFDFETIQLGVRGSEEHHVNAVGFSFEEDQGVFSEIAFYDDAMNHPQDSVAREACFSMRYWCEQQEEKFLRWKPGRRKKSKLTWELGRGRESRRETAQEAGEEGGFICAEAAVAGDSEDSEEEDEPRENDEDSVPWWFDPVPGVRDPCEDHGHADRDRALGKFLDFLLDERFYGYTLIAHNAGRFDAVLLLKGLHERKVVVKPLFDGNSSFLLEVPFLKLRIIDSYRYIKTSLANFEKRFPDLTTQGHQLRTGDSEEDQDETERKKGDFPHFFNLPENYEYVGDLPDRRYFFASPDTEKAKEAYEKIRKERSAATPWNFKEEMHSYLMQDVRVLRGGCLSFALEFYEFQQGLRKTMPKERRDEEEERAKKRKKKAPWFHPFSRPFFTVSTFVHALWRWFEMPRDSLYLLSNQRSGRKTSLMELEWLGWLNWKRESDQTAIQTAENHPNGQAKCGPYYPDGVLRDKGGAITKVFELLGCAVHYHRQEDPNCPLTQKFLPGSANPFGRRCENAHEAWMKKKLFYSKAGLRVEFIWECEFAKLKEESQSLRRYLSEVRYLHGRPPQRLKIRAGLRGGRTEVFRMLFDAQKEEREDLWYIDKNSLYPTMAVFKEFPVGPSEILIGERLDKLEVGAKGFFLEGERLTGLVQATVLPPGSLFLPALPVNIDGKLKFGLCRTCLQQQQQDFCRHRDSERSLTDVWTTCELEFAVECGYIVEKVWEIFFYRNTSKLFQKFYTLLARQKLHAEGFPNQISTDAEKQRYVDDLNDSMPGLELTVEKVQKNPAQREFAKLCSNSQLGKFSQNDLRPQALYVTSYHQFAELLFRSAKANVAGLTPLSDELAEVRMEPIDALTGKHANVHTVVYSFVTAFARIDMLKDMRFLMSRGCRVFYSDTDSIIFSKPKTEDWEALDSRLGFGSKAYGKYKFETEGKMESFASLGAKNYSYITETGESALKCRGFSVHDENTKRLLSHETMKSMILGFSRGESMSLSVEGRRISCDRLSRKVVNVQTTKKYSNHVFDKRWLHRNTNGECDSVLTTLPFGMRDLEMTDCDNL